MADHYDTDEKNTARSLILEYVAATGTSVSRIFTLPSVHGHCARLFRSTFPESHIVGIERNEMVVLHSDLIIGDRGNPALQCVNEFYIGNVSDMVHGGVLRERKWQRNRALDQGYAPRPRASSASFEPFDLIYLDFTAQPDPKVKQLVDDFLRRFARPGSVVALTLVMNKRDDEEATSMYPRALYHSYRNAMSTIGLLIWEHR